MPNLRPVRSTEAPDQVLDLLGQVEADLGMTPDFFRILANAPAALQGYLSLDRALAAGSLPAGLRMRIAIAVSEANGCAYCVASHAALGKALGLTEEDVHDSRRGKAVDSATAAALEFARNVTARRGSVHRDEIVALRRHGYGDREIVEIVATVALATFANYVNEVGGTELDFPEAPDLDSPQRTGDES